MDATQKKAYNLVTAMITDKKCDALYDMTVIVPVKFLRMNRATEQLLIAYLEPPLSSDDDELLFQLTQSNELPPPPTWPLFEALVIEAFCMYYCYQ